MPKSPGAAAAAELAKKLGTEPIFIVEIDWGTEIQQYSDKDYLGVPGKILNASALDAVIKFQGTGSSGSVSLTLDDTDGSVKSILDTTDIQRRPVKVYQAFDPLALGEKFLLFTGEISTPIEWSESERVVRFDVVAELEDSEIGFSPEEGEFDFISESAIGKAWPLCFGSPLRVPAVKITDAVRGTSLTRYSTITLSELDALCNNCEAFATARVRKENADNNAGISDEFYTQLVDTMTIANTNMINSLETLIFKAPDQEDNLRSFKDVCIDIGLNNLTIDTRLAEFNEAEAEIPAAQAVVDGINQLIQSESAKPGPDQDLDKLDKLFKQLNGELVTREIKAYELDFNGDIIKANTVVVGTEQVFEQGAQDDLNDLEALSNAAVASITAAQANLAVLNPQRTSLEQAITEFTLTEIIVDGGEDFPQGTPVNIIVNGAKFRGTFADQVFTISEQWLPLFSDIELAEERENDNENEFWINDPTIALKGQYCFFFNRYVFQIHNQIGQRCFMKPIIYEQTGSLELTGVIRDNQPIVREIFEPILLDRPRVISQTSAIIPQVWWDIIDANGLPDYASGRGQLEIRNYVIEIGDDVYLEGNYEDIYIANLIPSTEVKEVLARRTVNGVEKILPVPSRYYSINLNESIAGQNATTIRFVRPLTQYVDEEWGEEVFVSLTSSEGPNTADVIEYLLNTYTDLTPDAATFASVNTSLVNYPSHFALLERTDTISTIENIAWQARCAVFMRNETAFIKYLSVEESAVRTLTEDDPIAETFEVHLSPTDDLVTKFTAEWLADYTQEEPHKIVLRNNVGKYGLIEQEYDFFIYNVRDLVYKSATFWMIRYSNTWKIAVFKAFLNQLELDNYDTVALNFTDNLIASASVKGVVGRVEYDSADHTLSIEVMTSVRAGFLSTYVFFWPGSADVGELYPTEDDLFAGGASG